MTLQILRTATPNNPPTGLEPGQLAVEMATPRLWCGVPASINSSRRVELALAGGDGGDFSTGDAMLTLDDAAEPGWILMDDGTIGDAQSEATTRAHDDCWPLFRLLWHIGDIGLPVFPSRGASAEDDWAAHKSISLPRQRGRAVVGGGQGAGITFRMLGSVFGEESHAQLGDELPQHAHAVNDPFHGHSAATSANAVGNGYHVTNANSATLTWFQWWQYGYTVNVQGAATGASLQNTGSSTPFNIVQPSTAWNIMLKL